MENFDFVSLALDLVMVIAVLIPVIIGLKSGFVKTVFRFCKLIGAVILAFGVRIVSLHPWIREMVLF